MYAVLPCCLGTMSRCEASCFSCGNESFFFSAILRRQLRRHIHTYFWLVRTLTKKHTFWSPRPPLHLVRASFLLFFLNRLRWRRVSKTAAGSTANVWQPRSLLQMFGKKHRRDTGRRRVPLNVPADDTIILAPGSSCYVVRIGLT